MANTVKEIIEKLQEFDKNLKVYASDQCGGSYPVTKDCIKLIDAKTKDGNWIKEVEIG